MKPCVEWHKLSKRLPTDRQVVLVMSEGWTHPRVLEYVAFPFSRLLDRQNGWHCWYPERMQWTPVPLPDAGVPVPQKGQQDA